MVRLAAAQLGLALTGMIGDHERDSRALRIEWAFVPDVARYCLASSAILLEIVSGLIVRPDRLTKNVQGVTDRVMSERLMLDLGTLVGKRDAHEIVYELTRQATDQTVPVHELAAERKEITENLTVPPRKTIFEQASYLGTLSTLTIGVVAEARRRIGTARSIKQV
jgi:adenylosuccinate lyase